LENSRHLWLAIGTTFGLVIYPFSYGLLALIESPSLPLQLIGVVGAVLMFIHAIPGLILGLPSDELLLGGINGIVWAGVYGYLGFRIDQSRLKRLPNFFGVHYVAVDDALVSALRLKDAAGVYVISVDPESIADLAGIRSGDVILEYCGQPIKAVSQLHDLIKNTEKGITIPLNIWRKSSELLIKIHF
jgi:hypothetical protein